MCDPCTTPVFGLLDLESESTIRFGEAHEGKKMTRSHLRLELSLMISIILSGLPAVASVIGGPTTNGANGHIYYLLSAQTWSNSQAEAVSLGGHLATVNDADEDAWLWSTFGQPSSFGNIHLWIGLNDATVDGTFAWVSGAPVTYTNWGVGEPSGSSGGVKQDYVADSSSRSR